MEFAVRKSTGDKCSSPACGKPITVGEPVVVTTSISFGERGSDFGFHPKCVQPDQVSSVVADWDKVLGWKKLHEDLKEDVKTAFEEVLKNKGKKAATPVKRKAAESKTDSSSKPKKTTKSLTPVKAKEKADKADKAAKDKEGGPKRPMNAYMHFANAERQNINETNPGLALKEITPLLGAAWKAADAETKKKYEEAVTADKERYAKQKKEFDETGKFTKTPEEIELDKTRAEKKKASKEKETQKRQAAKQEKKTETPEKKSAKTEKSSEEAEDEGGAAPAEEEAEEVEENAEEEEATKEDEVEDADAGEEE